MVKLAASLQAQSLLEKLFLLGSSSHKQLISCKYLTLTFNDV
jgi:hypothetical protein